MKQLLITFNARHAFAIAALVVILQASCRAPTPRNFVEFVTTLDRVAPVDAARLVHMFGSKISCADHYANGNVQCEGRDIEVANTTIEKLDFRGGTNGRGILIFELSKADCLDVFSFKRDFGEGFGSQGCTDGFVCVYYVHPRTWGRLSISLRGERFSETNTNCAKDILLDFD